MLLSLLVALASILSARPVYAAGIVVNTNADDTTSDGFCALREAITNAKNDAATYADCTAGSGTDTITSDASLSGATIHLTSTLTINSSLSIDGSALPSKITISGDTDNNGTGNVRVFQVNSNIAVTLNSLVITKGTAAFGGGIYDADFNGTLTIINSTLSNTTATSGSGGAIKNDGAPVITNSTFSGNSATGYGGAIHPDGGTITVMNSTLYA